MGVEMISLLSALLMNAALADPCGMVPPIQLLGDAVVTVERTGVQETYLFFADGIETIVIRPGFKGSAEQFGMLVPFSSAPAIRKVPDETFEHLAAAVDPPLVTVEFYEPHRNIVRSGRARGRVFGCARQVDDPEPISLSGRHGRYGRGLHLGPLGVRGRQGAGGCETGYRSAFWHAAG